MSIEPPARKREEPATHEGISVVGGPRGLRLNLGFPVFSQGRAIPRWPYKADDRLIGYRVSDPVKGKAKVHSWKLRDGKLRYMGSFPSPSVAVSRIETAWAQAERDLSAEKQRVAVNPPVRRRGPPVSK